MKYEYTPKRKQHIWSLGNELSIVAETKSDMRALKLFREMIEKADYAAGGSSAMGSAVYIHLYATGADDASGPAKSLEFKVRFVKEKR